MKRNDILTKNVKKGPLWVLFKANKGRKNMKEEVLENEVEEKKSPFETEKIIKLVSKFALPCVISLVVNALYNIVDQIFIGQAVGYVGNAATNVVFPLTVIAMAFAVLIGDGTAAFLSLRLGEGKKEEASKGVGNALILISIVGVLFLFLGIVLKEQLLTLFGVTQAVHDLAVNYMKYIVIGLPFMMVVTMLNSVIRADGSPRYAMVSMLSGAILNIVLDYLFLFRFSMGVEGAAIATVIGQVVSFVISILYLRKIKTIDLNKQTIKPNKDIIKGICSLGISSFITQMAITIVMIVMNRSLSFYGAQSIYGSEIPLSALGIVMKVNQILISIIVGIGIGSQPIIGFNYGAKNYTRVKKTYFTALAIVTIATSIGLILFEIIPQVIVNLFGQEEGLYNEFALKCFRIFLMLCICNGIQITSGIFFQAIGKPLKSIIISLSRQILFFVPLALFLPKFFGIDGLLYAGPVADGMAFLVAGCFIFFEMKKIVRLEKQNSMYKIEGVRKERI